MIKEKEFLELADVETRLMRTASFCYVDYHLHVGWVLLLTPSVVLLLAQEVQQNWIMMIKILNLKAHSPRRYISQIIYLEFRRRRKAAKRKISAVRSFSQIF